MINANHVVLNYKRNMKLLSMTDFVISQSMVFSNGDITIKELSSSILKYALFLQQELELWMFSPIDGIDKTIFKNVHYHTVKGQEGARFYLVSNTQVFNSDDDGNHLYWHHYTIESLLSDCDEAIEINYDIYG